MKSQDYWKRRFEQIEAAQNQKGIEYYHNIEKQYRKAADEVEKQILKWYSRFATENGVSMAEAKRLLNSRELAEFRWDVKEYIAKGEKIGLDNTWMKQLENASAKVHVSRLEALKVQIQQRAEMLCAYEHDSIDELARKIYTDGYYHSAFEIQKGFGVGWDLMKLDTRRIDKVISKPWAADGMNFSGRIWRDRAQLVNELHTQLTQTIITGGSPETAVKALSKRFDVSKAKARRLVMTESAFFASASQRDCFNDLDVEKYEIVATLDLKTSQTCRDLDGKVFPMSEYNVGVTAPPFHVYCRTVTVPWFEDNEIAERAARGADGKTYYVKGDMKYDDWYNSFVEGSSKEGLTEIASNIANKGIMAFGDAKTHDDLIAIAKDRWQVETFDDSFKYLDFETMKGTFAEMDKVYEHFPQLKGTVKEYGVGQSGWAATSKSSKGSAIRFNGSSFGKNNVGTYKNDYAKSVETLFHPKGTNPFSTGVHELGHSVEAIIIDKLDYPRFMAQEVWVDCEMAQGIVSEACRLAKKTPQGKGLRNAELIQQISRYATYSKSETMAEAFADYFANGDEAAILSQKIIEVTERWLKE